MKKTALINLMVVMLMAIAAKSNAQTQPNYYIGKWDVLLKGLPQGDAHILFKLADSVGHLKGVLVDTTAAHKDVPLTCAAGQENTRSKVPLVPALIGSPLGSVPCGASYCKAR